MADWSHRTNQRPSTTLRRVEPIICCGTPFHSEDLLAGVLRRNPIWSWRRFAATFDDERLPLPDSLAVEVGASDSQRAVSAAAERTVREAVADHPATPRPEPEDAQVLGWKDGRQPWNSTAEIAKRWGI